jgi:alkaline phosphatase D
VKVLVEGLDAGATYWYRFVVDSLVSPAGRTRTPHRDSGAAQQVRLAVASCQSYTAGFYPAWRAIAAADLDGVVFLGDYIYESGGSGPTAVRADGATANDLASYRAKYRLYRSDPDLRAAHAAHGFAPIWDDHELVNNCSSATLVEDPERARAAYRAWWEYQPVWPIDGDRIHRRLRWGDLVDLTLLDTRQYRDPEITDAAGNAFLAGPTLDPPLSGVHAPERTLLGAAQRDWLLEGLGRAQQDGVRWKLIGNQVMISPIRLLDLDEPGLRALRPDLPEHAGVYVNFDDWSGFMAERDRVTEHLRDERISHVAFLTGDIHSFWQSDVLGDIDEPNSPVVAQEFVCGSISSRGLEVLGPLAGSVEDILRGLRPGFRHVDLQRRGYGLVECTPSGASVEFRTVDALAPRSAERRRVRFDWTLGDDRVRVARL